ncbi:MAG: FmdB family zinc ribbon protein [Candidatus Pacearchaeota archaeon]|jgi:putative FmdB family regulatory protein
MPLFTYVCERKNCGHSGEYLIRNADETPYCPRCESPLVRQVSKPSVICSGERTSQLELNVGGVNHEITLTGGFKADGLPIAGAICGDCGVGVIGEVVEVPKPKNPIDVSAN